MTRPQHTEEDDQVRQFAERFDRFCDRVGLDKPAMAKALDVSPRTLLRWSTGETPPRFSHLLRIYKLAEQFGVWPELFLDSTRTAILRSVQESYADLEEDRYFVRLRLRKGGSRAVLLKAIMEIIARHDGELCRINGPLSGSQDSDTELLGISISLPDARKLDNLTGEMGKLEQVLRVAHPDEHAKAAHPYISTDKSRSG